MHAALSRKNKKGKNIASGQHSGQGKSRGTLFANGAVLSGGDSLHFDFVLGLRAGNHERIEVSKQLI